MPFINVKLIEGVFSSDQKQQIIERLTDAMVSIEGENMRQVTWCVIEEVAKAGVLITAEGVLPSATGALVRRAAGQRTVTDGPFTEAKEVIGGYWLIQAKSKEEAVEWAKRCPAADGDVIEVRQVFEMADFPPEVQEAAR